MNNISAVIIVKDQPPHLFETIDSLNDFVSEIVIVDIGITSSLNEKLQLHKNIHIVHLQKEVPYVELIREETKQYAKNNNVLFIDPDEILSNEAKKIIKQELHHYSYFSFPRKNIIFKKWIQHSRWWPDYQIRLFKKESVIWPKQIHHQPQTNGKAYIFPSEEKYALVHYNYDNIDHYFNKYLRYAKAQATESVRSNQPLTIAGSLKQALLEFMSRFFADEGFKDGIHGFVLSLLQMFYPIVVYFYFWEMNSYKQEKSHEKIADEAQYFFQQGLKETNYWMTKKNGKKGIMNKIRSALINILLK